LGIIPPDHAAAILPPERLVQISGSIIGDSLQGHRCTQLPTELLVSGSDEDEGLIEAGKISDCAALRIGASFYTPGRTAMSKPRQNFVGLRHL
jgi:hypothetical protein